MFRKLILFISICLILGSTAQAALYLWNGSAGDGLWDTPGNWTVTDSTWTWPNEEYGNRQVNSDTIAIDILNGDAVTREGQLGIDGAADGSTTGVLTLNNASSLTVNDDLATSTDPGRRGQIDVLGGSTLTVTGDNDLRIADDPNTWGALNIVDSTVNIGDDLRLDEGEGYVNISGSSILNADDGITVADAATAVSYLDISGTAVITLVDDFKIDEGIGFITIGGDAVISFGDDCYLPDQTGEGTMTLTGNSVFNVGDDMTIADDAGTVGHVIVTGNATLNAPDELYLADEPGAFATLDVNGTATLNVGDDLDVGEDGPAVCNIGENAVVNVVDTIYIPHNSPLGVYEARMTISGNASVTCDDIQVVNDGGNTGFLHISGNPTLNTRLFYMNNDEGLPGNSEVIMDGGTVNVTESTTINDDNNGTAKFTMNGGSFYSGDYLNVSDNLDGTAHLTMNGGEMITANRLRLGKDGGEDTGQVRVFLNGGLLQAEGLDIKITDTQIICAGGVLRIRQPFQPDPVDDPNNWWGLSEADMQSLIDNGTIVADPNVYIIITDGAYTVLTEPPVKAWAPNPADDATGVSTAPPTTTFASGDVPKDIPDWSWTIRENIIGEVISTLDVADSLTILDLNVELDIKKPGNNADLNVYLKSPDGKQVELFTDVGFQGSNFTNTILDDEASTSIKNGKAPFTGSYKPEGKLSAFDGRNTEGTWQLKIQDDWPGGPGTLNSWQIVIESPILLSWKPGANAVSQDVYFSDKFDDVYDSVDTALLGNIAGDATGIEIGSLEVGTTYYWRVDAIQADGTVLSGDIWSFTTVDATP